MPTAKSHRSLKNNLFHNLDPRLERRGWVKSAVHFPEAWVVCSSSILPRPPNHPSNFASGSYFLHRIVCEMGEAKPSQHAGFVEICVAECKPEFMARSSQLYYFMVSSHEKLSLALKVLGPCFTLLHLSIVLDHIQPLRSSLLSREHQFVPSISFRNLVMSKNSLPN